MAKFHQIRKNFLRLVCLVKTTILADCPGHWATATNWPPTREGMNIPNFDMNRNVDIMLEFSIAFKKLHWWSCFIRCPP